MTPGTDLLDRTASTCLDAEGAAHHARERLKGRLREYGSVRLGRNERDTARSRAEWSLAGIEYIQALMVIGETEDRHDTAGRSKLGALLTELACTSRTPRPDSHTTPADTGTDDLLQARHRVWACWDTYHTLRVSPARDQVALDHARSQLEHALIDLLRVLVTARADEDQQHITEIRRRQDLGMTLHPADAFPATAWTSHATYRARERARSQALERDKHRYDRQAAKAPK